MNISTQVVIRLVGGTAHDFVFSVPADKVPPFLGVGQPLARYHSESGDAEVRIFRYVPSDAS